MRKFSHCFGRESRSKGEEAAILGKEKREVIFFFFVFCFGEEKSLPRVCKRKRKKRVSGHQSSVLGPFRVHPFFFFKVESIL